MEDVVDAIAVRNANGEQFIVREYVSFVPRLAALGLTRGPGTKRLELNTGESVRRVDDGRFEVVSTGELLFRIGAD